MTASTVTFSTTIEASPQIQLPRGHGVGVQIVANTVEVATTSLDETDDRVMLLALPGSARLIDLVIFNDDLDSATNITVDIGLFYGPNINGHTAGEAINDACLATAITTFQSANTLGVRDGYEANDIANIGKPLWQIGGLTRDPGIVYIGFSVAAGNASAQAGTVSAYALFV